MRTGEQVTGPLEMFEGVAYFASFESLSDPSNACALGQSRLWALDYLQGDSTVPAGYASTVSFPQPRFESIAGTGNFDRHFQGPYSEDLILGVGITQRPTCVRGAEEVDPYLGRRYRVFETGGGTFQLVAQVSGGNHATSDRSVATVTQALPTPESFTSVHAWAGRVDY